MQNPFSLFGCASPGAIFLRRAVIAFLVSLVFVVASPAAHAVVCNGSNDGSPCDDGNACTQTDTCQGGACVGSNPVTCTALDQCHAPGTCNPGTGVCTNPVRTDGTPCSDGNACTINDFCVAGVCS